MIMGVLSVLVGIMVALCMVPLGHGGMQSSSALTFADNFTPLPDTKLPLALNNLQYHGTTTLSFKHKDCIVLCVDSKASIGNYVGSRCVKKVFPVSRNIVATMAGGAADCAYWIRRISRVKNMMEYRLDATLGARAVARLLSSSLREYKGQGLSVGTMVAGWDKRKGPALFYVDSEGACIEGDMFCVGSGSQLAYAILDTVAANEGVPGRGAESIATSGLDEAGPKLASGSSKVDDRPSLDPSSKPSATSTTKHGASNALAALSLEEAISAAVKAVRHATFRDGFSGGYINVLVVNETGIHHVKRVDSKTIRI